MAIIKLIFDESSISITILQKLWFIGKDQTIVKIILSQGKTIQIFGGK